MGAVREKEGGKGKCRGTWSPRDRSKRGFIKSRPAYPAFLLFLNEFLKEVLKDYDSKYLFFCFFLSPPSSPPNNEIDGTA